MLRHVGARVEELDLVAPVAHQAVRHEPAHERAPHGSEGPQVNQL